MITDLQRVHAHFDIDTIFQTILPEYGMTQRRPQIDLAHTMLDCMIDSRIALSDAGTGIGKTYAYLTAGVVFHKYLQQSGENPQAVVISTASIALQHAIQTEYIPFLSKALLEAGYIRSPLLSVIRKGKSHYVCDDRLDKRLRKVKLDKKNAKSAKALLSLTRILDTDGASHLSGYDRDQVTVPRFCRCGRESCRYEKYMQECCSGSYLFQICNHNLLLADAIHRAGKRQPILPDFCALVLDEAHKLPDAARQMFGRTLSYDDILSLIRGLRTEHFTLAAQNLLTSLKPVAKGMSAIDENAIVAFEDNRAELLLAALKTLNMIQRNIGGELTPPVRSELRQMIVTLSLFTDEDSDIILYADTDEHQRPLLCASAADLSSQIEKALWSIQQPILLTSGTLAVGRDFSRFRKEACISEGNRLMESVSLSPFDYETRCMLYIPYEAPEYSDTDLRGYYRRLTEEIISLTTISQGHALVLFNSYAAMSAVSEQLEKSEYPYPLFSLSRNSVRVVEAFKQSGNGVLLATGAAWEGFDFPGDMISMLIIPRLPFPIPDAFSEHQKESYDSLKAFIQNVALPDMQIKLRQGFGRAFRLETDACAVAILDERSLRGRRYHQAVRQALPDMPMTGNRKSVERFLRSVKDRAFFGEEE